MRRAATIPPTLLCITLLSVLPAAAEAPQEEPAAPIAVFSDRVDVALSTFDVRVVDGMWRPVTGLGTDDFRVRLDGAEVPVVAVDWIPASEDPEHDPLRIEAGPLTGDYRLYRWPERVVFLFQAGLAPGKAIGHLRLLPRLQEMVAELPADTLAAVAAFHSHLTLHQDLTTDRETLAAAMKLGHGYHHAALPAPRRGRPSLARHLDAGVVARVVDPTRAVELVARALAAEPGPASIVYVGWSLEGPGSAWTSMLDTLLMAGIPLFILDVTDADYHSLEVRLRFAARQTGGHFSNTRDFPGREVTRVRNALVHGHYRVTVRRPDLPAGFYPLKVTLRGWDGYRRVLAPRHAVVWRRGEGSRAR